MRLQLALNVDSLDDAIEFYTKVFGVPPAKVKPGYANWAIEDPPLKLVIFEGAGVHGSINHLGVEVDTVEEVLSAERRLRDSGLVTSGIDEAQCCFADKTETWVEGVDGHMWEWYVKHRDVEDQHASPENGSPVGVAIGQRFPAASGDVCCGS